MTQRTTLEVRQREIRSALAELASTENLTDENRSEIKKLTDESRNNDSKLNAIAASEPEVRESTETAEAREVRELRESVRLNRYIGAAMGNRAVDGREAEYNAALNLPEGHLPLEIFAPAATEQRAETDVDTTVQPQAWIDRLFADTAASHLGLTMESVGAGVASHPITKTGATPAQRGREEDTDVGAWTIGVTEVKPTRMSIHYRFAVEDAARLPGLESALRRDMAMALRERVDYAIFKGDTGANENTADIAAISGTTGIGARTLSQTNKLKWPETVVAFTHLLDGIHAESLGDLNVVAFVGANRLWLGTSANTNRNESVAQVMRGNGLSWRTRGGIEAATTNNKLGAMIGLNRGIAGAGVVCTWSGAQLIHDPYSGAKAGQVQLTLHSLWNYAVVRPANFAKLTFVT